MGRLPRLVRSYRMVVCRFFFFLSCVTNNAQLLLLLLIQSILVDGWPAEMLATQRRYYFSGNLHADVRDAADACADMLGTPREESMLVENASIGAVIVAQRWMWKFIETERSGVCVCVCVCVRACVHAIMNVALPCIVVPVLFNGDSPRVFRACFLFAALRLIC